MTTPTWDTFCCTFSEQHKSVDELLNFRYKPFSIVSLISASLGVFGAIYQIVPIHETVQRRSALSGERQRKIIKLLAIADLFACLGIIVRSVMWIIFYENRTESQRMNDHRLACALISFWIMYFYTSTYMWTVCYAIDVYVTLKENAWLPPNVGSSYTTKRYSSRQIIQGRLGRYTDQERSLVNKLKMKFSHIVIVFYVCWLPNIISNVILWSEWKRLHEWHVDLRGFIIGLWYFMAIVNPLQAVLNSVVYRGWANCSNLKTFFANMFRNRITLGIIPDDSVENERSDEVNGREQLINRA
ncbi:G-protein coupled receptor 143-like [Centruroides sculpturatus]|uniref:G-protein coupled receptor 143-like n=1 Tax=Centruroides sculpturatus TaxID=218467 RepID=UPI000C6E70C9|nr:G-protein coupled receptor 143-like [Centruroides sculpturatus]